MLDPIVLRSFLAVARSQNFSEAARGLGLGQPAVSQHVRRLEKQVGRRLFVRDTHSVKLTPDGAAMVTFAQSILEANDRAERYFSETKLRGRLRFGASEDFVAASLADLLRDFRRLHPHLDLELTVGLSGWLNAKLDAGELDLTLAKRPPGDERGQLVWREPLVWAGAPGAVVDPHQPVSLILYPPPSITRDHVLTALEQVGRTWRIACCSSSLSGLRAAALAELGVLALPRGLIPSGLVELAPDLSLPTLGETEFVLRGAGRSLRPPARQLAETILAHGARVLRQHAHSSER
jgi:DNA-binding transcriptional LysR family regulator